MYYFRKWQYNLKNVENKQKIGVSWPHHNLEYFTQIVYYAFLRRIAKEKRQMDIKEKIIEKSGYDHVFTVDGDASSEYNQIKSRVEMNSKR